MDVVNDKLSHTDKIKIISRQLKNTAAVWFSIITDNISTYPELIEQKLINAIGMMKWREKLEFN